jgi:hypothetical protein
LINIVFTTDMGMHAQDLKSCALTAVKSAEVFLSTR